MWMSFFLLVAKPNVCYTEQRKQDTAASEQAWRGTRRNIMGTHADETHTVETMISDLSNVIPGWREGIPLIRLFACGPFTIEVLHEAPAGDPAQARYVPLPPERLHGRGPGAHLPQAADQPDGSLRPQRLAHRAPARGRVPHHPAPPGKHCLLRAPPAQLARWRQTFRDAALCARQS